MKSVAVTIPTLGASHLLDALASLPPGLPLYLRDNRADNWGVAKSWNWGIRAALAHGAEYVLVLNDDVRLDTPDFIDRLIADLAQEGVILVSGRPDHVHATAPDTRLAMSAFLCDRRLFDEIGEFDETFWPAYFEDADMLHRIQMSGRWRTHFDANAVFHHWVSSTIREVGSARRNRKAHYRANRERFYQKWGFYSDQAKKS
jgi:GT2 family glycosyltransferase